MENTHYFVGLDLGQSQDFTAVCVVERSETVAEHVDGATYERKWEVRYHVRYLQRLNLGTSYVQVVQHIKSLVANPVLEKCSTLVVDATGVGAPVVDLLRASELGCPIVPVTITSGDSESHNNGVFRVPKRDLILGLQVLFQTQQLAIAERLPEAQALMKELMNMRVKISQSGHDSYAAWREGTHDDLVLCVALACWRAKSKKRSTLGVNRPLWSW
jgi:hypothetical protein